MHTPSAGPDVMRYELIDCTGWYVLTSPVRVVEAQ